MGDLILIEQGMELPADAILIQGQGVSCNEGSITGESKIMEKRAISEESHYEHFNSTLTGSTFVTEGSGIAMVICVGENSQKGMIEKTLNIEDKPTPLQMKLESIAARVGNIGMTVAIMTVIVMTFKLIYTEYIVKNCKESKDVNCKEMDYITLFQEIVRFLIVGVTIIVVAIPEGLPLAVTISLAYSVSKMQKGNCLVRKIDSAETMGGADEIVTDKTGTLTTNVMTVRGFYTMDQTFIEEQKFDNLKLNHLDNRALISDGVLYNCSAYVQINKDSKKEEVIGNPSESGVLRFFIDHSVNVDTIL